MSHTYVMAFESTHAAMASEAALGVCACARGHDSDPARDIGGLRHVDALRCGRRCRSGHARTGVRRCPRPLGAVSRDVENGIRASREAIKPAKQNEEGCALPRFLYTVGFCGQPTKSAVRKNGAVKLAEMRVNRTHPRRSARPATALKAARSTRNLFISICRLLQRSNQANILRNFRGGPTRRVMRSRKARKRGPGIDAAKAFAGRHRAS